MKRIYQNPETQIVTISVEQIIAASPISPDSTNKDLNNAPETQETSGNLSRRRDIWAEEEEEEQY